MGRNRQRDTPAGILIIEHDLGEMERVVQAMEGADCDTAAVRSASSALALCKEEVLDLVLLDISQPGVDGQDAARRIRRSPLLGRLPIVAIAAPSTPAEAARLRRAGVTAIVTRPLDAPRLQQTIETLLRKVSRKHKGQRGATHSSRSA
jgi:two-component system cell cycle response regulator